jgi:hypothetical protein
MAYSYGPPSIVRDGLVLAYDAANYKSYVSGSATWRDLTENGITGSLTNGPTFDRSNGGSIVLDGSNDSVNFIYDLRSSWSYECWVMHNAVSRFAFLGQAGPGPTNGALHILFGNGTAIRFGMWNNDSDATNLVTDTNRWYQYCFTYNHNSPYTKQAFRNGQALSLGTVSGPNQYVGTGVVKIGAVYDANANGKFASVKLYNRVLTASEILQNYNAMKTRFGLA